MMNKGHLYILLALTFGLLMVNLSSYSQDLKSLDVKSLSSSQVKEAQKKLEQSGMTTQQAVEAARLKGASEDQIRQMLKRMEEAKRLNAGGKDSLEVNKELADSTLMSLMDEEERALTEQKDKKKGLEPDTITFGAYLFNSKNLTFEPNLKMQTPKEYEIGVGDEIVINIWGNSTQDYQLIVDRNGQIVIPVVGPVWVAGRSFDEASRAIRQRLTGIYSDMGGAQPGTFAQVRMGQMRSIRVNLVGEVNLPGTYTLPATATLFNALYMSGGPNPIGSFRSIQVFRDNKLLKTVDVYDFLIHGNQGQDITLKNNDMILVPVAGKRVRTTGEFRRINGFEVKDGEALGDVVRYGGGLTEDAYREMIKIYRKTQKGTRVFDIPEAAFGSTQLSDGDLILAQPIHDSIRNRVTVIGSVFRPGEYEWKSGMQLSELLQKADSITPEAYRLFGQITRVNPDKTLKMLNFNLEQVLRGQSDVGLEPEDLVEIKSIYDLKDEPTILVSGRVRNAGEYPYRENMTIQDAIYLASGFTEDADSSYLQVSRRLSYKEAATVSDKLVEVFTLKVPRTLESGAMDSTFHLMPYDQIYIRKSPGFRDQGTVSIAGEVVYSGTFPITSKNDRISDLIKWAGGTTPDAYLGASRFMKVDVGQVGIDLDKIILQPGGRQDLLLEPGDSLFIPKEPQTVNVLGQVQNPFATTYVPNKGVKYYIEMSGGWADSPDKGSVYVTYPDGSSGNTRGWLIYRYPKVKPGARIMVPKEPAREPRPDRSAIWLSVASTAASLGVSVVAIVNMLKQ